MAYTKKGGLVPTKEEVREEFDMSNASWDAGTDKITTTGGEVECTVTATEKNLSVACNDFPDIKSGTMEIAANAANVVVPES